MTFPEASHHQPHQMIITQAWAPFFLSAFGDTVEIVGATIEQRWRKRRQKGVNICEDSIGYMIYDTRI